jgi:uncharacterized repeat protein (TIGR02543 family)
VIYDPGTQGTWQAKDETYTNLALDDPTPIFGTNTGTDPAVDHTEGWTFSGWQPTWSPTVTDNITYVAQWTKTTQPIFYTLTYNGNGHTSGTVPLGGSYPAGYSVLITNQGNMLREGYAFQGWAYNADAKTPDFATGSTAYHTLTNDVTLYAVWTSKEAPPHAKYTVTYQPGAYGTFDAVSFECALGELTPKAPEVTGQLGWRFIGWTPEPTPTVEGDATYVAQWEQVVFTVKFVDWDGSVLKTQTVPYGGSATAPANPSRNGYTFTGWSPSTFTNITSDLTVTARYTQNNGGGGNNGGSGGNGGNNGGSQTNKPTNTPLPSTTPPLPSTTPDASKSKEETIQTWALVNLILSIAGLILAIAIGIYTLLQHKKKQKQTQTNNTQTQTDNTETQKQKSQHRNLWLAVTLAMGIAGISAFLLTEDLSRTMTLVDKWTIVNVIIFAAQIIAIVFTFKRKKNNNTEETKSSAHTFNTQ